MNHHPNRRATLRALAALLTLPAWRAHAQADGRPVRLILPVSAGSGVDAIARAASQALGKALGAPVVIENLPGAGGVVGSQAIVRAAPDGHTLGFVSNNHVIYPGVVKNLSFDPINDITPIVHVATSPMVIVASPKLPVNNLKEFVALLKASPGKYNMASSGNGTILHLAGELFKEQAGVFSTHVPYRGFGPMVQDIVGGQVDWGVGALPALVGQMRSGSLKALAIATAERNSAAPNLPTAVEQGYKDYLIGGWSAIVGPKGMAPETVKRVHAAVTAAFETPEVKDAMAKQGNTIVLMSPEATKAHFVSESKRYLTLLKRAGVTAQ